MARIPTLSYDRGTLILHPPPRGKDWLDYALWDDRVERFRIPAHQYRQLLDVFSKNSIEVEDRAIDYGTVQLVPRLQMTPYPHQVEALEAWQRSGHRGVVVLPTAAGKTYLAQLGMQLLQLNTLILVPTLDLMHQWYAHLQAAFPDTEIGLLGAGNRDRSPILVATYDSGAIHAESLGNHYGLLIFDECHHLPTDFYRIIAEFAIAPYRLGLTATPERSDGKHTELATLIGPDVYRTSAAALAGTVLADYETVQIRVQLSQQERDRYDTCIATRNNFLRNNNIGLGTLQGWQHFVQISARSAAGRQAMIAHRQARAIAFGTEAKLRVLVDLLAEHYPEQTLIFTDDNATVYHISQELLIPAITHQTPVKERHAILSRFRTGEYKTIVASRVLNEGVDVPEARVAIVLSGTGSPRELIQRLGRVLRKGKDSQKRAMLYEIVAENTSEENTAKRRQPQAPKAHPTRQLELMPSPYKPVEERLPKAAENTSDREYGNG